MKPFLQTFALLLGIFYLVHTTTATVTNLRFYGLWLVVPQSPTSNGNILKFDTTLIIPPGSPDKDVDSEVQAFWPGVQGKGLLQNVITNGGEPGQWWLQPYYCCNPGTRLGTEIQVFPGDRVTNTFTLNPQTMKWHDSFIVTPGNEASGRGRSIILDAFDFDQEEVAKDNSTAGDRFTMVYMTIELQGAGTWNWGAVEWRDILLRANNTETKWCTDGPQLRGGIEFNYAFTPPVVWTSDDRTTTCYIAQMSFKSP